MRISQLRTVLLLSLTYLIFAILLNSVGTVILQVINSYDVSKSAASSLEGFKDIPIAVVSFLLASSLPRYGFRRAMITGLALVGGFCLLMPLISGFFMTKLLFLCTGIGFALAKVSVYSSIGLVAESRQDHASILNIVEGLFMIGVLAGYWMFSYFIEPENPASLHWLNVYWVLAGLCGIAIILWLVTPLDESGAHIDENGNAVQDFLAMLEMVKLKLVGIFVISVFLYVLIEQGVGTWLPTFNNEILRLPMDMSVQAASIFAACLAIGRLSAGALLQRLNWYVLLNSCLIAMIVLIVISLPMANATEMDAGNVNWLNVSPAAYVFPLIGLFMAPIYPAINSVVLSAMPKSRHAGMTGLIVIFSALGGTTGSIATGIAFDSIEGSGAFYLTIIPVAGIMLTLFFFRKSVRHERNHIAEEEKV